MVSLILPLCQLPSALCLHSSAFDLNLILCCYVNHTDEIQVGRINNIANRYFERVLFPGQRLLFEAPKSAELEIYSSSFSTALLARIRCETLALAK